jgi:hypothetical protein
MYKLDNVWETVVESLNLPLNAEISTNCLYSAIISCTGFSRKETVKNLIQSFELRGFIKKSDKVGIWIISNIPIKEKKEDWFEV